MMAQLTRRLPTPILTISPRKHSVSPMVIFSLVAPSDRQWHLSAGLFRGSVGERQQVIIRLSQGPKGH